MTEVFFNAVFPVFALMGIGFAFCRFGLFDATMAGAVNRFVFYVSLPALLFGLLARASFEEFDLPALAAYGVSEAVMYAIGFAIGRFGFKRGVRESLLLGLALGLVNHVLYVLPIATSLFGEAASAPIAAIVTIDSIFVYGATMMVMDATSDANPSLSGVIRRFSRNPQVWAILGGIAFAASDAALPKGVSVFVDFAGRTAAPCALFALGVVLSAQGAPERPSLPVLYCALKLIAHPAMVWVLVFLVFDAGADWSKPLMMVSAAPCGAMAFVLALQYEVEIRHIARAIIYTSVGSVITVSLAALI